MRKGLRENRTRRGNEIGSDRWERGDEKGTKYKYEKEETKYEMRLREERRE
jgi:hypothetical protein